MGSTFSAGDRQKRRYAHCVAPIRFSQRRLIVKIEMVNAAGDKCHFCAKTRIFRDSTYKNAILKVR